MGGIKSTKSPSDGLISEEEAIEIIAATLIQVRDLVFALQLFSLTIFLAILIQ
jgi:hypothetical protein